MDQKIGPGFMMDVIDCACVIHGNAYDWIYVERLKSMLQRNLTPQVRLHVFTENDRIVPPDMIKHNLIEWADIYGPKKGWWYKIQMFDPRHDLDRLLYFDLDVVITGNIDWIWQLKPRYFWALKDFKYLWRPKWTGINSSVMSWNTKQFSWIWQRFQENNININVKRWHGDQDFLSAMIDPKDLRYLDPNKIISWRWQAKDGGLDFKTRKYADPNTGTKISEDVDILIFHGKPNPHEVHDPVVQQHWR